jgi:uncharacterized glyoxalase superfamily protein PhnB
METKIHYWTKDVEKVISYYVEKLGFDLLYRQPLDGPANFCILKISDSQIMFAEPPVFDVTNQTDGNLLETVSKRLDHPGPLSVYIGINDIDAHFDFVTNQGATIIEPIWNTPWGNRQFSILDPDDNITTFYTE